MESHVRAEIMALVKALAGSAGEGGSADPKELETLARLQKIVEETYPMDMVPGGISSNGDLNNTHQLAVSRRSGWIPYFGETLTVTTTPGITAYVRIYDRNKQILVPTGPGAATTGSYIQVNYSTNSPLTLQLDEYTDQEIGYWRFTYTCGDEEATDLLTEDCAYVTHGRPFVTEDDLGRVSSLDDTQLATAKTVEVLGIPAYLNDLSDYTQYGLTEPGWYVFARIKARDGVKATGDTTVEGANAHIVTGDGYVDVAVRFDVAAMSRKVTVNWGTYQENFVFNANDLAIRNLREPQDI